MITFHKITNRGTYTAERFNFIKTVEGSEFRPYVDTKGIATIGIGFNLRGLKIQTEVFTALGIDPKSEYLTDAGKAKESGYQNDIIKIVSKSYSGNPFGAKTCRANASDRGANNNIYYTGNEEGYYMERRVL